MEKICIAGHGSSTNATALKVLQSFPKEFDALIINGPGDTLPSYVPELANEHLNLQFHDIVAPRENMTLPQKHHIEKALAWAKGREKLMVACHAGISRSSATAFVIACQEWGIDDAVKIFDPNIHMPNARIVWLGSQILENSRVWDVFSAWNGEYLDENLSGLKAWFTKNVI